MIHIWQIPNEFPEELIGEYDKTLSPDRFLFQRAQRISTEKVPVIRFNASIDRLTDFDDLANNAMVPLIGPRLVSVLKATGAEVEFVEARVLAADGELPEYRILNVLKVANALDKSKSEFFNIPGTNQIMGFRKIVFRNVELLIARDADYMGNILVQEELATKLKHVSPGLGIYKPDELHL